MSETENVHLYYCQLIKPFLVVKVQSTAIEKPAYQANVGTVKPCYQANVGTVNPTFTARFYIAYIREVNEKGKAYFEFVPGHYDTS